MKQSILFAKTKKHFPKDEESINARLLTQAGYIKKLMAGVYSYLPLGLRVLNNINTIIREEMTQIGGQELYMPSLQPKELWGKTGRWDVLSQIMYQFKDQYQKEVGLGTTHEEVVTDLAKEIIVSYRDLPKYVFQIQDKFRNEPRAKSGLIRCREFQMKDLYSFHATEKDLDDYYPTVSEAYRKIFTRCGLDPIVVEASGGDFSKQYSHEFQVISPAGEDTIIFCPECKSGQNAEITAQTNLKNCPHCGRQQDKGKSVEVGNIFKLGTKFSSDLDLLYNDQSGQRKPVFMGCYGIGPGRLLGTVVEVHNDKNGIIWPNTITPYHIHLLNLTPDGKNTKISENLYSSLQKKGFTVLFDDREESAGIKLKDADLIGIPARLVVSAKTGQKIELKLRTDKNAELLNEATLIKQLKDYFHEK